MRFTTEGRIKMTTGQDLDLRVNDTVIWRGGFGYFEPRRAKVLAIEIITRPGSKDGDEVQSVPWAMVKGRDVIVTMETGSWAYANQIKPLIRN